MVSRSTTCVRRLGEFRRACAQSLSRRLEDVDAALRRLPSRPDSAEEALRLLQALMGSAGPLGFGAVFRAAATLRALVRQMIDAAPDDRAPLLRTALAHLDDVRRQTGLLDSRPVPPAETRPRRVLLLVSADDALPGLLTHYGYDVRRCASLSAAREQAVDLRPSAVLVDAADEAAPSLAEIRRVQPLGIPVLLLGPDDLAFRLEAVRAGVDGVFRKADLGGLIDRLDRMEAVAPAEPFRILLVDDDPVAGAVHAAALSAAGMRVRTVRDPMAVMGPLRETAPDLVLLDMDMGVCTGDELAAVIRQHDDLVGIPIVFLSSETGTDRQLAARSAGADDFLVKPVSPERLVAEVTLRAERARTLRAHMMRDGQTGALNHGAFMTQLRLEVQRAQRSGRRLALVRVDIDRFRAPNERLGEAEGDRMIRDVARLLQKRLRSTDLVGRSGGDRFVALLGDTTAEDAGSVIEDIRRSFAGLRPSATLRAGIAAFPAHPDAELLLEAAEKALARAAREGGDRVELSPE